MKIIKSLLILTTVLFLSCEDKTDNSTSLELEFIHKAGNQDFEYGKLYENQAGNEFSLRLWRTYISQIELVKADGSVYAVPNSYHLIEPIDENRFLLTLSDIPTEAYQSIRFYIGVAGDENLSGQSVGDLDPSNNMAWNWTTGYKFIRMDGEFQDMAGNRRGVVVHIGTEANLKLQSFNFGEVLNLARGQNRLTFEMNVLEAFQNPHSIDFEELSDFQFNNEADLIGENYQEGFIRLSE